MQHADGEILAARAAEKFGACLFRFPPCRICSIEDVAENTTTVLVSVYVMRDRTLWKTSSSASGQMLGADTSPPT